MSMVCGLDLHRQQITFDALETASGEVWRGRVWQPDREVPALAVPRRRSSRQRAAGGDGRGGLHRLALRGRGDHRGRVRSTSGGAGRHAGRVWPQAARQDRPLRRSAVARFVAVRRAPPSRGSRRPLCWSGGNGCGCTSHWSINGGCGSSASTPSCSSTASPCPRHRSARRHPRPVTQRRGELDGSRPATGAGRLLDARGHRRRGAVVEAGAATLRSSPAGVPGAGRGQLRHRRVDRRGGVVQPGDCRRFSRSEQVVATLAWTSASTAPTAIAPVAT